MNRRYWLVKYVQHGFEFPVFLFGTENDVINYCMMELDHKCTYHGATDDEVTAGKTLKMKFYMV